MTRKTRDARKDGKGSGRGKAITVQFFLDEDRLVRELARLDGDRPIADTVRVLALAEARRRTAPELVASAVA
jgi:hypothetical protein